MKSFLSKKEQENIHLLNEQSNFINTKINIKNKLLNKSINEITQTWSKKMQNIIDDIINLDFKLLFNGTTNLLDILTVILFNIKKIFIDQNRSFYMGITLIIVSIVLFILF